MLFTTGTEQREISVVDPLSRLPASPVTAAEERARRSLQTSKFSRVWCVCTLCYEGM